MFYYIYIQVEQIHFGTLSGYLNKTKMEDQSKMEKSSRLQSDLMDSYCLDTDAPTTHP